jgi:hypothetical protein
MVWKATAHDLPVSVLLKVHGSYSDGAGGVCCLVAHDRVLDAQLDWEDIVVVKLCIQRAACSFIPLEKNHSTLTLYRRNLP